MTEPQSLRFSSEAEQLFAAHVADLESGRGDRFDDLCAAHPQLAEELRGLRAQWQQVAGVLQRLLPDAPAAVGGMETTQPVELGPDVETSREELVRQLAEHSPPRSRYELRGEFARGGMGRILNAWDKDLRRELAMKIAMGKKDLAVPRSSPAVDAPTLGRFLEEAQVTGQLDHPGIVPVHELGLDASGQVYFTMRLVKGRNLSEVFKLVHEGKDGWTRTRALGVLLKVCEAMAYAHAKGVVHRDLKPSNVMVGRFGEVYVMDWGLARVIGRKDPHDLRLRAPDATRTLRTARSEHTAHTPDSPIITMDGTIIGTPSYMPPEQAEGRVEELGPRADVYALGSILYELLSGRAPYLRPGARPSPHTILAALLQGPPTPVEKLAQDVPPELLAICERAMARDPAQRYADMSELSEDLSAFLEHRVVSAYRTGAVAELVKWVERNKGLAAALASAVALLVLGLATALWLRQVAEQRRVDAELRHAEVVRLSALQDLDELLDRADALWPIRPAIIEEGEAWVRDARALVADLPAHREKVSELRARLAGSADADRETRWWEGQLAKLIAGLEALEAGLLAPDAMVVELGPSIPRRLALAQRLRDGFAPGGEFAQAWERDLPAIRKEYPGLALPPQLGLVPLGPDPDSNLWEFADLQTGEPPRRDSDGRLVLTEATGVVFVLLPGGIFPMGSQKERPKEPNYYRQAVDDEFPLRDIELSPFFLSKYEMTQGQWLRVTGANPSVYGPHFSNSEGYTRWGRPFDLTHPVEKVSWSQCERVCGRLGFTLPSEAQWEYAVRAETTTPWWHGEDAELLSETANLLDLYAKNNGLQRSGDPAPWDDGATLHAPAGTYTPNPFGLHEMLGNVYEWCLDGYHDRYPDSVGPDPVAPPVDSRSRVRRGGSYAVNPDLVRSACRGRENQDTAQPECGVRPARKIER